MNDMKYYRETTYERTEIAREEALRSVGAKNLQLMEENVRRFPGVGECLIVDGTSFEVSMN